MSIEVQILDSYYLPRFGVEDEQQRVYLGKLLDNIHVVLEEILATTPAPDSAKYLLYDTPPATLPNAAKLVGSSSITMTPSAGLETLSVAASGVTANTYGDATHVPQFTVLADGRVTGVTNVGISSGTVTSVSVTTNNGISGSVATATTTPAITINGAQAAFYGVASGTNTYVVTLSPVSTSYVTGVTYTVTFTNANTSTATLNANSLGAKAIQLAGAALTSGQIPANATLDLVYDGTQFQIIGTSGSGTVTTTGSPANGNLTKFSGATSITNGDLSGDVTTSGTLATTIANNAVTTAKINNNAVTLAKLATQADQTVLVNISGGAAVPTASTFDAANIQRTYFASSTSGTTTYTATLSPVPSAYQDGAQYVFTASSTNIGSAPTINFNSLGALTIKINGASLVAGQLVGGATYQGIRSGSTLILSSVGGTTFNYPSVNTLQYGWSDRDDLIYAPYVNTLANLTWRHTIALATGTAPALVATVEKGHPGMYRADTGTGTNIGGFQIYFGADTSDNTGSLGLDMGGGSDLVWYIKTDSTLSNGTTRYSLNGGWFSALTGTPTDRAQWVYTDNVSSGVFRINVRSSGVTQSEVVGSTTVAASTWYRLRLNINAAYTAITLYISVGTVSGGVTTWAAEYQDCQYTGTMPSNTVAYVGEFSLQKTLGTGHAFASIDGWEAAVYLAAPRGG